MAHFCAAATGPSGRSAWSIIPPPLTTPPWHMQMPSGGGVHSIIFAPPRGHIPAAVDILRQEPSAAPGGERLDRQERRLPGARRSRRSRYLHRHTRRQGARMCATRKKRQGRQHPPQAGPRCLAIGAQVGLAHRLPGQRRPSPFLGRGGRVQAAMTGPVWRPWGRARSSAGLPPRLRRRSAVSPARPEEQEAGRERRGGSPVEGMSPPNSHHDREETILPDLATAFSESTFSAPEMMTPATARSLPS